MSVRLCPHHPGWLTKGAATPRGRDGVYAWADRMGFHLARLSSLSSGGSSSTRHQQTPTLRPQHGIILCGEQAAAQGEVSYPGGAGEPSCPGWTRIPGLRFPCRPERSQRPQPWKIPVTGSPTRFQQGSRDCPWGIGKTRWRKSRDPRRSSNWFRTLWREISPGTGSGRRVRPFLGRPPPQPRW